MSTRRLDDGNTSLSDVVAEVCRRGDPIAEIILLQCFLDSHCNGFEITPGQATVRWISFGQYQQIFLLLCEKIVARAQKASDIRHPVLLGRHRATVATAEHLLRDLLGSLVRIARLTKFDEPGILSEATCIEIKW